MNNKRIIEIHDPIFQQNFLMYVGYDYQDFHKEVIGEKYKGDTSIFDGYTVNTDNAEICIWVKNINNLPVLVHELCHATQFALYDSCYVDRKEAEIPAYYMEFLLSEILKERGV